MQVVFEKLDLPEQGVVELTMQHSFEIKVTAEEARRQVNRWLSWEISMLIAADPPSLVIGKHVVWRVPAWIGFPSRGRAGTVGTVDIDVRTGEIYNLAETKAAIEHCAKAIAAKLPPYQPHKSVPKEFIPEDIPPAPRLELAE